MKKLLLLLLVITNFTTYAFKPKTNFNEISVSSTNEEINAYLVKFYQSKYSFGKSTSVLDEKKSVIILTEVILEGDKRARGYVAISKETDDFLFFVDIDRDKFEITTFDVTSNKIENFKNINKSENYNTTNEFDLIYSIDNNTNTEKIKFWGWSCGNQIILPNGDCVRSCVHYIFWIENGNDVRGC